MRDPKLIDFHQNPIPEQRIPDDWRAKYLDRDPQQLAYDVARAFDQQHELKKLQRKERDLLLSKYLETKKQLGKAKWMIWGMGLIVSPVISKIVTLILHYLFK
jgi:hypothetical protein